VSPEEAERRLLPGGDGSKSDHPTDQNAAVDGPVSSAARSSSLSTRSMDTSSKQGRQQVEVVWGNDRGSLLATHTGSGRLYTYESIGGRTRRLCTLRGRPCGTW